MVDQEYIIRNKSKFMDDDEIQNLLTITRTWLADCGCLGVCPNGLGVSMGGWLSGAECLATWPWLADWLAGVNFEWTWLTALISVI